MMQAKQNTGLIRLIRACGHSWSGLRLAFRHEAAFRQELALVVPLAIVALWLDVTGVERVLLLGSLLLVLIVELLNSALEAVVDRIGSEYHALSGQAKDVASAAVLLSLLLAAATWLLILL